MGAPAMKSVSFGDGQLRFRIPAGWVEDREADGSVAFYDAETQDGTLRLKLMTFTAEEVLAPHVALHELEALSPEPGQSLEALPNGNALRAHREQGEAEGERTTLHVWLLASVDPPHRMRLAVFSYTVRAAAADELATRRLVAALQQEIREARFAHQVQALA